MRLQQRFVAIASLAVLIPAGQASAVPSFSGAEGFGAVTPGGRGGQVIHVTNLNDSGPGSFREAVTANGPRTVVFDVAGQINLESEINVLNPYLTIAGQTAPGGGITIAGETLSMDTHDVIVRYLRFRRGTTDREDDSFGPDRTPGNMIIDHVSASWGYDENISIYRNKNEAGNVLPTHNVTIQWTISSEGLNEPSADHPFGHAFGSTLGGKGVNFHHNLWASNTGRNPSLSFSHFIDFRNNVLFNWQHRSMDGAGPEAHVNVINNYYKPGPATGKANNAAQNPIPHLKVLIVEPEIREGVFEGGVGWWYVDGNVVEGHPEVTADNWEGESEVAPDVFARGVQFEQPFPLEWARVTSPHIDLSNPGPYPFGPDSRDPYDAIIPALPTIATQTAGDAYLAVLAGAGASLVRDSVDVRVVDVATTGNATAGPDGDGIVHTIDQVGGYPVIPFVERDASFDTDGDGMPNTWEIKFGLNGADPADRNDDFDADGFTNLEEYLNEIGAFPAVQEIVWDNELGNGRYAQIENWGLAFQPSRFDAAVIDNGTVVVDAIGQDAGILKLGTNPGDSATLNITAGWLHVADELVIGADDDATAAVNLSGGVLAAARLSKGSGGSLSFTGGKLSADGVDFNLANEGGTIAPGGSRHPLLPNDGSSIGQTEVTGSLTFESGALEIEIAGREMGQYDRLEVHGPTTLGGTLRVRLLETNAGPFEPQWGDAFIFLAAYGGAEGAFDDFDLPQLAPGLTWTITPGDVVLYLAVITALDGDYNDNGVVDAADYTVWRDHLGQQRTLLNETASLGVVDMADYNAWKNNFGATRGTLGRGTFSTVPEPAVLSFVASAAALVLLRRHCGARQLVATR